MAFLTDRNNRATTRYLIGNGISRWLSENCAKDVCILENHDARARKCTELMTMNAPHCNNGDASSVSGSGNLRAINDYCSQVPQQTRLPQAPAATAGGATTPTTIAPTGQTTTSGNTVVIRGGLS
jgi:hypothetical protein